MNRGLLYMQGDIKLLKHLFYKMEWSLAVWLASRACKRPYFIEGGYYLLLGFVLSTLEKQELHM